MRQQTGQRRRVAAVRRVLGPAVVLASLLVAADTDVVSGCICGGSGDPHDKVQESNAVFSGYAIAVRPAFVSTRQGSRVVSRPMPSITFYVTNSWKGPVGGTLAGDFIDVVVEPATSCSYAFKLGHQYLIYSYRLPNSSVLMADKCSVLETSEATEDVLILGAGHPPTLARTVLAAGAALLLTIPMRRKRTM